MTSNYLVSGAVQMDCGAILRHAIVGLCGAVTHANMCGGPLLSHHPPVEARLPPPPACGYHVVG